MYINLLEKKSEYTKEEIGKYIIFDIAYRKAA